MSARDVLIRILTQGDSSGSEEVSRGLDQMGERAKRAGKALSIRVTAPLTALGGVAVKFAADAAESADKLEAVFGPATDSVNAKIAELRDTIPATTAQLQSLFSGIQDLLVPLGMAPDEAAEMSTSIVKLAGDLASFNNIPIEEALSRIRSGLVGQYEPLLEFGVALNATTVKAKAFEQGIGDGRRELTAAERAQVSYQLILEGTSAAHGNAADTADSAANQFKFLRSETSELLTVIGEQLLPAITPVVSGLKDAATAGQDLDPVVVRAGVSLAALAAATGPVLVGLAAIVKATKTLNPAMAGLTVATGFTVTALANLAIAYKEAADASDELNDRQTDLTRSLTVDLKEAASEADIAGVIRQSTSALAGVEGELADIESKIRESSRRGRMRQQHQERINFLETEQRLLQTNIRLAQEKGEEIVSENQARAKAAALAEEEKIAAEQKAAAEKEAAARLEAQREARETLLEDLDLEEAILQAKIDGNDDVLKQLQDQKREQVIINQLQKTGVDHDEATARAERFVALQNEAAAAEKKRREESRNKPTSDGDDGNGDLRTRLGLLDQVDQRETQSRQLRNGVRQEEFIDVGGTRQQRFFDGGRQIDESQAFQDPASSPPSPGGETGSPGRGGSGGPSAPIDTAPITEAVTAATPDLSPIADAIVSALNSYQSQINDLAGQIRDLAN